MTLVDAVLTWVLKASITTSVICTYYLGRHWLTHLSGPDRDDMIVKLCDISTQLRKLGHTMAAEYAFNLAEELEGDSVGQRYDI